MPQRLDGISAEYVLLEDALSAFTIDARIPDIFRVDNHHRPVAALVHAAGVIDSDDAFQSVLGRSLFQHLVHVLGALGRAGFARRADENMVSVLTHDGGAGTRGTRGTGERR